MKSADAMRALCAATLLLLASAVARADELPLPLEPADPDRPIELLWDRTYGQAELKKVPGTTAPHGVADITYDEQKGPLTLVVDLAATRPDDRKGHVRLGIHVECTGTPCGIPIDKSVMGLDTQFMGESVAILDGQPTPVWVQRRAYSYTFKQGDTVMFGASVESAENLEPRVLRLRVIRGRHDDAGLPGQTTRKELLLKVVGSVLGLLVLALWWMRRA